MGHPRTRTRPMCFSAVPSPPPCTVGVTCIRTRARTLGATCTQARVRTLGATCTQARVPSHLDPRTNPHRFDKFPKIRGCLVKKASFGCSGASFSLQNGSKLGHFERFVAQNHAEQHFATIETLFSDQAHAKTAKIREIPAFRSAFNRWSQPEPTAILSNERSDTRTSRNIRRRMTTTTTQR